MRRFQDTGQHHCQGCGGQGQDLNQCRKTWQGEFRRSRQWARCSIGGTFGSKAPIPTVEGFGYGGSM